MHAYAGGDMRDLDEREKCKIITDEIAYVDHLSVFKILIIYLWQLHKILGAFKTQLKTL